MLLSAPLFVGVLSIAGVGASRHPHPPNGLTLSALDSTDCPGSSQALDKGDTIIDANHPKYFVEVSEISTRGTRRLIHAARSAADRSRMICQHINANVDIASKIGIRVNRAFLLDHNFGGRFAISAKLDGPSGSRPVEVPGYSVIGHATESVSANVADISAIIATMTEVVKESKEVRNDLDAIVQQSTASQKAAQDTYRRSATVLVDSRELLRGDSAALRQAQGALTTLAADSTNGPDARAAMLKTVSDAAIKLAQDERQWQQASVRFTMDSAALRAGTLREYLIQARNALAKRQHALIAIQQVSAPPNAALVRLYARVNQRLPELMIGLARAADSTWSAVLKQDFLPMSERELSVWDSAVSNLVTALIDLSSTSVGQEAVSRMHALALQSMKDAEITLRQTGADVGDVLVVTIADTVGETNDNRVLEVRLPVRQFGFVRRITDAVLMMNVPGLPEDAEVTAAQALANSSKQGSTHTFPLNLRGSPSAGVSMSWTFLPRPSDDYSKMPVALREFFDWIRFGVGMNASVISVPHKVVTFAPNAAITESAKDPEVGYTFGGLVTAFDSAIQWSAGRTMTGDRARTYTAIGISFLAATDKAKDLFKSLSK